MLTLLLWVLLLAFLGLISDIHHQREDLLFVFKLDAVYVSAFSIFFGGSAIYNERRSRRILSRTFESRRTPAISFRTGARRNPGLRQSIASRSA